MENKAEKKRETKVSIHKGRFREFSDLLKCKDIHVIGVPEDEQREKGEEGLCEQIIAENFPTGKRHRHQNPEGLPLDSTKTNYQQGIS